MKQRQSMMKKTIGQCIAIVLLVSNLPGLAHADSSSPQLPEINAKAFILMDYASGTVLAESNADSKENPASLVKIMASYVIGQALKSGKITSNDMVTVGKDAWATGNPILRGSSLMFLKPGDQVSVADLNRGIVIQSGNDASIALADYIAGSQDVFVGLMNQYAKQLGLTNSHFKTVHGLDADGQYSTARDMALLSQALIRDVPDEYALNKEKSFTFNNIHQPNRNRLLWNTTLQVDGIKTGYTDGAGYNLVSSAQQTASRLIAVVLGAPSDKVRFADSQKLLTWGFRFFDSVTPLKANAPLAEQRVWFGQANQVPLGSLKDIAISVPKGKADQVKVDYQLTEPTLKAPLKSGEVVGNIHFILQGKVIAKAPLVALQTVPETNWLGKIWDFLVMHIQQWFS